MTQRTLVLIKPDAVRRGLVGNVLSRFEAKGLTVVALEQRLIDAAQADAGTIRKDFASSIEANAVHGSDSPESAAFEIPYFFGALEIFAR